MSLPFDLSLYLVTDPAMTARRGLLETVAAAIEGGVTMVQLRDKDGSSEAMIEAGRALHAVLGPRGIPLIINDRIDVAKAVGAEGIHLGQDDLSPATARALLGRRAIIGLTVDDARPLAGYDPSAVDYVGISPLFSTGTKPDAGPALGVEAFAVLRRQLPCPVVAIGGITADNAGQAVAAGADGVAVVSAICAAPDPRAAARALRLVVDAARNRDPSGA